MDITGRIAIIYNDGKLYRVLHEAYDILKDAGLTAKIEKLYKNRPSH